MALHKEPCNLRQSKIDFSKHSQKHLQFEPIIREVIRKEEIRFVSALCTFVTCFVILCHRSGIFYFDIRRRYNLKISIVRRFECLKKMLVVNLKKADDSMRAAVSGFTFSCNIVFIILTTLKIRAVRNEIDHLTSQEDGSRHRKKLNIAVRK